MTMTTVKMMPKMREDDRAGRHPQPTQENDDDNDDHYDADHADDDVCLHLLDKRMTTM